MDIKTTIEEQIAECEKALNLQRHVVSAHEGALMALKRLSQTVMMKEEEAAEAAHDGAS